MTSATIEKPSTSSATPKTRGAARSPNVETISKALPRFPYVAAGPSVVIKLFWTTLANSRMIPNRNTAQSFNQYDDIAANQIGDYRNAKKTQRDQFVPVTSIGQKAEHVPEKSWHCPENAK